MTNNKKYNPKEKEVEFNDEILKLIADDNFIIVNKSIASKIGLNESVILGELASEYRYYKKNNMLVYGWFYSTVENIQENTSLTGRQQRPAINNLVKLNLIEQENRGLPPKRFFKLNFLEIKNLLDCLKTQDATPKSDKM